ncbi:hypothetical protein CBL_21296, partial [Carabus blaptoides fortunei]
MALNKNIGTLNDIVGIEVSKKLKHLYILSQNERAVITKLVSVFRKRWKQVNRTEKIFFEKFEEWLNVPVSIKIEIKRTETSTSNTMGRPSSSWEDLTDRSKRRRTEKIREEHNVQTLAYATQMSLRASGKLQASKVVKDVIVGSPSKALKCCKSMQRVTENIPSGNEALSL